MTQRLRGLRLLALAALVAVPSTLTFVATGAAAPDPEEVGHESVVDSSFLPRSLDDSPTTVVVQLRGNSVAEAQAAAGRKLAGSEKNQIKGQLKAGQDALVPQIQATGGTVLAQFQGALNGIKVQIAASKLGQLSALPGVTALLPVHEDVLENATSVPYIGAPTVWSAPTNYRGEGIKIGVIDTGIDYTHANFNGPGTVAAYAAADAADTQPANPLYFGPAAPRVKGGWDFVGDAYTGSATTPMPDPNPLDCNTGNAGGHGSHTAGTAAGGGVTSAGAAYTGPYNSTIYTPGAWRIGPGVAPKADIYSYRVFGCSGSTNLTVDAINMAFDEGMDVINMSLGSAFGSADDASAEASTNVAKAGMIVVASAGNNGPNQYITGSPATGTGAISVAANDSTTSFPGASMAISTDGSITAINANGATFANGTVLPVAVLRTSYPNGPVSLGCDPAEYGNYPGGVAGKLVVTLRGTCARVARAIFGEKAGAAAVAMINTDSGFPPFEGQITQNPDTGEFFTVTIPFFGIRGLLGPAATADPDNLITADTPQGAGGTVTLGNTTIANPNGTGLASFTSGGPRTGDSWLKPDITAPGVSIFSTGVGTGTGARINSGTSMSSPHVAGVAALVKQAHPGWNQVQEWKAAIVNTGDPSAIGGTAPYRTSRAGSGLVQPVNAVKTDVIALSDTATATLNFGFDELKANFSRSKQIKLRNKGGSSATFNIAQTNAAGSPHSIVLGSSSVTIPAGGEATVNVTLNVPVATAGDSNGAALSFREVAGLVTFTPTGGSNNGVALRVPYYLVPRALSGINVQMQKSVTTGSPSTNANVSNPSGPIAGNVDFYALGVEDANDAGTSSADVRAVGVQSFPSGANATIVFAVNTWDRWSNASTNEFDILVDVDPANANGDDYAIVGADQGLVQAQAFNGRMAAFVFDLKAPVAPTSVAFFATARTDSSTALLPVLHSQLCVAGNPCLSLANPRFTYHINSFDLRSDFVDIVPGVGSYNAWSSSISQGMFASVPVGGGGAVPVTINPAEWALTPALGSMIVSLDNKAGKEEAALMPLELK
jgi:minor extracellular serine protease Vpr